MDIGIGEKPSNPAEPVVVNPQYTVEDPEYRKAHEHAAKTGECPFCSEGFRNNADRPELFVNGGWWARERDPFHLTDREGKYPKKYFLIISEKHRTDRLTRYDMAAIGEIIGWLVDTYKLGGYAICTRQGDPVLAGRTVVHQHVHVIEPNPKENGEGSIPFDWPVG